MSRKGTGYDNAVAESFFSMLKNELVHERDYHMREETQAELFEFIRGILQWSAAASDFGLCQSRTV